MKKKLALADLNVKSFVTADARAGAPVPAKTQNLAECGTTTAWYSELYTACTCPESWDCSGAFICL